MELRIDSAELQQALSKGPAVLSKHMDRAIGRIVLQMANDARQGAPKAFSQLTNSILTSQPSALEGRVEVAAEHGLYVEQGTGRQRAGGGAYRSPPPAPSIEDWIKIVGIEPNDPSMSSEDLSFLIARSIATKGTPPRPFLQPAFDNNKADAERRMNAAIDAALAEIAA